MCPAYALGFAAVVLAGVALGDGYGRRRVSSPGCHELAGEHEGGAPFGARPGRRLLERIDLELNSLLL
jgi:hypothetical protein